MSIEIICQGLSACSRCLFLFGMELLCFAGWHALKALTSCLMFTVIHSQNKFVCTLVMILSMPVWSCLCAFQIIGSLSVQGTPLTIFHLVFLSSNFQQSTHHLHTKQKV